APEAKEIVGEDAPDQEGNGAPANVDGEQRGHCLTSIPGISTQPFMYHLCREVRTCIPCSLLAFPSITNLHGPPLTRACCLVLRESPVRDQLRGGQGADAGCDRSLRLHPPASGRCQPALLARLADQA